MITHGGIFMPDVKDAEKTQIRYIARRFTQDLLDAPLSAGLSIYSETLDKLYRRSARWKICLKCGTIDAKESLDEKSHSCASGIGKLPVIISTSWVVLKDFFLSDKYIKVLEKIGVKPPTQPTPVTTETKEELAVSAQSDKVKASNTVK